MASRFTLNVRKRTDEELGNGPVRRLRAQGRIPAIVYGHDEPSVPLAVDAQELDRILHQISIDNTIIELKAEGDRKAPVPVLVREVQHHPYKPEVLHVDFFRITMGEKIDVEVPIELEGTASGVKNHGGILQHLVRELPVTCLPGEIPEKITVDVSALEIGDVVRVRDLPVPQGIEIHEDPERGVATVVPPAVLGEEEEAAVLVEEEMEPELVGRKREEEEEEEEVEEEGGEESGSEG